jgi:hypothetical protein
MGKRGETGTPATPPRGKVWSSIVAGWETVGWENEFVSVADVSRETLNKHPWSLGGGGAAELKANLVILDSLEGTGIEPWLWPYKARLSNNKMFGGRTKVEDGLKWFEYGRFTASKLRSPLSITFAFVATHNHFVLDRGGKVFKQLRADPQAPPRRQRRRPPRAARAAQLLGGLLLDEAGVPLPRQRRRSDGPRARGMDGAFYEFDSTKLKLFPLPTPAARPSPGPRALDRLANERRADDATAGPHRRHGWTDHRRAAPRARRPRVTDDGGLPPMVALQEELDWLNYACTASTPTATW